MKTKCDNESEKESEDNREYRIRNIEIKRARKRKSMRDSSFPAVRIKTEHLLLLSINRNVVFMSL